MTMNCIKRMPRYRYRVFLNGREIQSVWYTDRRRGVLKTYDVYNDGSCAVPTVDAKFIDPSWDAPIGGVLSKTMRGRITLSKIEKMSAKYRRRFNWMKHRRKVVKRWGIRDDD